MKFLEIRARVPIAEVAEHNGIIARRGGVVLCPFHNDKRPSAKLYPERLHCFVCNQSWDAVSLIAQLHGLTPLDAARRLSDNFNLDLFPDRPLTLQERRRIAEQARKREADKALTLAFRHWWDEAWRIVLWYHRYIEDNWELLRPRTIDEDISEEFAELLSNRSTTEYLLDLLFETTDEREKIAVFSGWKERIKEIELYRNSRITPREPNT